MTEKGSNPSQKLTKKELRAQARQIRRTQAERQAAFARMRRLVILGGGVTVGLGVLVAGGYSITKQFAPGLLFPEPEMPKGFDLLEKPWIPTKEAEILTSTTVIGKPIKDPSRAGTLSREYLNDLVNQLQDDSQDSQRRFSSVIRNLALVYTGLPNGQSARTSALMIDKSGIFLTCGHTFVKPELAEDESDFVLKHNNYPTFVSYPYLLKEYPVSQYMVDDYRDLALFYAPTGYRRGSTGVGLNLTGLSEGQDLWQVALLYPGDGRLYLDSLYGTVAGESERLRIARSDKYLERIPVKGMVPFGGSSGAPILNSSGRMAAVESGFYLPVNFNFSQEPNRVDYAGSTVASLFLLPPLVKDGEVRKLPIE